MNFLNFHGPQQGTQTPTRSGTDGQDIRWITSAISLLVVDTGWRLSIGTWKEEMKSTFRHKNVRRKCKEVKFVDKRNK